MLLVLSSFSALLQNSWRLLKWPHLNARLALSSCFDVLGVE